MKWYRLRLVPGACVPKVDSPGLGESRRGRGGSGPDASMVMYGFQLVSSGYGYIRLYTGINGTSKPSNC